MRHQKLPSDLTVEELLKALEDNHSQLNTDSTNKNSNLIPMPEYTGQYIDSNPVISFITAFNIKSGNHLVASHIVYDLFKVWNKFDRTTNLNFQEEFGKYFRRHKVVSLKKLITYYALNEKAATLAYYLDQYKKTNKRKYLTSKNYVKHYEKFFNDLSIEPGPLFVESDVLYHVYDTHMYRSKKKSHPFIRFELICGLFFEKKYFDKTNRPWFGVSDNIKQHISPQAVANWREGRKRFNDNKKAQPINEEHKKEIIYPESITQKE
jgi:hypothetical protein